MIVVTPDIESDAASTNTLVTPKRCQETPPLLPSLVYPSLLISTLAFIFTIINYVTFYLYKDIPFGLVPAIIAYIFTVPHHCAVLLLQWLERHQSESIFPFTPASPRAIVYSFAMLGLWAASATVSIINVIRDAGYLQGCISQETPGPDGTPTFRCVGWYHYRPPAMLYWCSLATAIACSLECCLIFAITTGCYLHYRRIKVAEQPTEIIPSPPSASITSESKVLST